MVDSDNVRDHRSIRSERGWDATQRERYLRRRGKAEQLAAYANRRNRTQVEAATRRRVHAVFGGMEGVRNRADSAAPHSKYGVVAH
jgi:hypothetical protein